MDRLYKVQLHFTCFRIKQLLFPDFSELWVDALSQHSAHILRHADTCTQTYVYDIVDIQLSS